MHDLDRKDLVFEADGYEFDNPEHEDDELPEQSEGVFDEIEESELAGDLLAVADEHELEHFLGNVFKRAIGKLGPISKVVGNNLGGLLKAAAKRALPSVASIAGGAIGGPIGAALANKASSTLGSMFGLELEGLSPEDQEFESAKQFVRLAGSALENAARVGPGTPPAAAARNAMIEAARRHAPGLLRGAGGPVARAQRGTWYRRGDRIVLVGV